MSAALSEIGGDKQTVENALSTIHSRLKCYTNDQITILDDLMSTIEAFYKTEKQTHEKMQGSLQKSLEHAQSLSYLGSSIIGSSWTTAVKELMEHYSQREAVYPVLKQVICENLKKVRAEKVDEHGKVLLYDEEIIKEMGDIERRTLKSKRAYDEACERVRQHLNPVKEKESGIKKLQSKLLPKNELEKLENAVIDTRNMYILHVCEMNYALKFYIEQFIVDLDRLLVCDLFQQVDKILQDLVYSEYERLRDTLQRAVHAAVGDGDEQKRRLLPKTFHTYPLVLQSDHNDQINTDEKHLTQLSTSYTSAINDLRETDQQIQLALESSALNAQQYKDSRMDSNKIRLKRLEMRKSIAMFVVERLETLVPNIKSAPVAVRTSTKFINGLKPFISSRKESNITNQSTDPTPSSPVSADSDTSHTRSGSTSMFPCQAVVLYDFEGTNDDEMTVRKDEKIFIESKPDYEGWLIARGRDRSGLVPEAYVQLLTPMGVPVEPVAMKTSATNVSMTATHSTRDDEADYFSDD
ncbi:unnamed protein product [Adineta ricciae]|uniref:SH3 domain-containing protein n=1 Tax=Adineta ricciae TaxID=249248 RepID=A0A813VEV5_ADIRI|nr:unnamed protein product [Adineta ricciae]